MKHTYSIRGRTKRITRRSLYSSRRFSRRRLRLRGALIALSLLALIAVAVAARTYHSINHPNLKPTISGKPIVETVIPAGKPFGIAEGDTLAGLSDDRLKHTLDSIQQLGVRWIRIDVSWADVQPASAGSYNWRALDRVIAAADARHLQVLGTLAYTPPWAAANSCSAAARLNQKCAPASDAQFAGFAAAAARRYDGKGVGAWEIWNEPNIQGFWQPIPSPYAYTRLLEASYAAIKQVAPNTTVLSGSLGPLDNSGASIAQLDFLAGMYAAGAEPYFDALGYHPYSYPALPSYVATWNGWSTMNDLSTSVRTIMTANGDGAKKVWVTEFGAPTDGSGPSATATNYDFLHHPNHVDEALQAVMVTQSATIYENSPWMGSMFYYTYQDAGTDTDNNEDFFGLIRHNGTDKPSYGALRTAIKSGR